MINNSKEFLEKKGIDYRKLAKILNISERQASNILSGENKALEKYLKIGYATDSIIEEIFRLDEQEIEELRIRIKQIEKL